MPSFFHSHSTLNLIYLDSQSLPVIPQDMTYYACLIMHSEAYIVVRKGDNVGWAKWKKVMCISHLPPSAISDQHWKQLLPFPGKAVSPPCSKCSYELNSLSSNPAALQCSCSATWRFWDMLWSLLGHFEILGYAVEPVWDEMLAVLLLAFNSGHVLSYPPSEAFCFWSLYC